MPGEPGNPGARAGLVLEVRRGSVRLRPRECRRRNRSGAAPMEYRRS